MPFPTTTMAKKATEKKPADGKKAGDKKNNAKGGEDGGEKGAKVSGSEVVDMDLFGATRPKHCI